MNPLDMRKLKAHFDGKVLIPHEPVDSPINQDLEIEVTISDLPEKPLEKLAKALDQFEPNQDWPTDGAAQHDHYLYGKNNIRI